MTDPRPTGTFCWFDLGTTDAAAAKAFYAAVCGWTYTDIPMGDLGTYTMVHKDGHDLGGLYELAGPMFEGVPSNFLHYVRITSVDQTVARCVELGGRAEMPGHDIPGRGRMAMLADPEGARFAVWEARGHGGTTTSPTDTGSFGWTELNTRAPEAAAKFYGELFGWAARADSGAMPYTEFSTAPGAPSFAGMMKMGEDHGDAPPHWLGYIMVDDCDAFAAAVGEHGGTTMVPPMTIPDVGRFAVFFDPTGAAFAAIQLNMPG